MNKEKINPKTKELLMLIGVGGVVAACLILPGLPRVLSYFQSKPDKKEWEKRWKRYNLSILKRNLKRLYDQGLVTTEKVLDEDVLVLTKKGKLRLTQNGLADLSLDLPKKWDKKWRLIIYDIEKSKKRQQGLFRHSLKKLKCLQLQKSVYLTPYPIEEEVKFLRDYFDLTGKVVLLVVEKIEHDRAYREYFGL